MSAVSCAKAAVSTRPRVPLRRKRPAGTRGGGDIDEPSAVTERVRSIGDRAASEIDAPGPRLTPTCGGRTRRPRTEEWPLPDDHPRRVCQLGALDPRSPITVAVGTAITRRPPHRSRRAELPHRAPASGRDVEPPVGTGVPEFWAGQPTRRDPHHPLARQPVPLAAPP